MDGARILKEIRRRLGDVDGILGTSTPEHTDLYLFEYVDSAVDILDVSDITTTTYVVSGTTIAPEPSNIDGILMATWSVSEILSSDIAKKVRSGELGVRFSTGQDEISTVEAARKIESAADKARRDYRRFVVLKLSDVDGASERLQ